MEYVHNFNGFLNESELNEGANHGDMTAVLGGDDKAFSKFFKTVKVGDTFEYAPNGVELDALSRESFITQGDIDLEAKQTSRDAKPVTCTVVGKGIGVSLHGGSFDWDGEEEDTIYFNLGNDKKTIYVLTNTY
jgi:hypothetical protein